jgi:hypothetical protein
LPAIAIQEKKVYIKPMPSTAIIVASGITLRGFLDSSP